MLLAPPADVPWTRLSSAMRLGREMVAGVARPSRSSVHRLGKMVHHLWQNGDPGGMPPARRPVEMNPRQVASWRPGAGPVPPVNRPTRMEIQGATS